MQSGSVGAPSDRPGCAKIAAPIGAPMRVVAALASWDAALRAIGFSAMWRLAEDGAGGALSAVLSTSLAGCALAALLGVYRRSAILEVDIAAWRAAAVCAIELGVWALAMHVAWARGVHGDDLVRLAAAVASIHAAAFVGRVALSRRLRGQLPRRRVLVLGAPAGAARMRRRISTLLAPAFDVVAPPVLGGVATPAQAVALGASEIVVAAAARYGASGTLAGDFATAGLRVRDAYRFLAEEAGYVETSVAGPDLGAMLAARVARRTGHCRRVFDVVVATLLLVLAAPVLAVAAIAIRLEGPGPILYRQRRVGRDGVPFTLFKLRTMRMDAEIDGPRMAERDDPRVTRVGLLLRRSRLDEVPQAINVLCGRMSIVGPRPERPVFVARLQAALPFYAWRHAVLPGITGWAQINRPYAATLADAREKLAYDLYYVAHRGPRLDALIVIRTLRVIVLGEGAR
jgi:exopolysaccharide biosynthesis polyprenyl glycosylphosphotransferase